MATNQYQLQPVFGLFPGRWVGLGVDGWIEIKATYPMSQLWLEAWAEVGKTKDIDPSKLNLTSTSYIAGC